MSSPLTLMRRLLPILLLALVLLPAAGADASWHGPCRPADAPDGATCTWWNAKVTFVADGDTLDARIPDLGEKRRIRFTGINAMELRVYSHRPSRRRGDCHGLAAAAFVDRYVAGSHRRIRLAAQRPASTSRGRLRRSVWVRSGGRWVDLAALEMQAGLALWLPAKTEWAHNREYAVMATQAAGERRALYNPTACGAGPDDDVPLGVTVNWDADNNDQKNRNGEWLDVRNLGTRDVSLAGWFVRDSWLRRDEGRREPGHVFPTGTVLPAGQTLRVRMGCGSNSALQIHWCQRRSVFENVTGQQRGLGDGGYLFDPDGDLRAMFMYPCVIGCVDPAAGRVRLVAHQRRPERITVVNTSSEAVDLSGHVLKYRYRGRAHQYVFQKAFAPGTVLAPGGRAHWAPKGDRFRDSGGVVELRTLDNLLTGCVDWGSKRC